MSLSQAIFWNVISGVTAIAGLLAVFVAEVDSTSLGLLLLMGAGVFVYVSLANVVPEIVGTQNKRKKLLQVVAFLVGILCIGFTIGVHTHCTEVAEGSAMAMVHGHEHASDGSHA